MAPSNVIAIAPSPTSSELKAARAELATWLDINAIINSGRMPPVEWPKAKAVLELLDKHVGIAQAAVDSLTPPEPTAPEPLGRVPEEGIDDELRRIIRAREDAEQPGDDGNQTPDPDSTVIPDLAKESH